MLYINVNTSFPQYNKYPQKPLLANHDEAIRKYL